MRRLIRRATAAIFIAAVFVLAGAGVTHQIAYVITSGVSMEPTYHTGDLTIVARDSSYRIGEIVAYHNRAARLVVLHRIVGGDASGFVFKGDNNQSIDPIKPSQPQLIGRAVLHIPAGGIWLKRLLSPPIIGGLAFFILVGSATAVQTRRRGKKRGTGTVFRTADPSARSGGSIGNWPPWLQATAGGFLAAALLAALFSLLAWTRATDRITTTPQRDGATMTFSYTASVPQTPVYDSTTVTSPDPIFRKVTNTVDVHYAYQGDPGSISVAAQLADSNGWHSTVPLAAATDFNDSSYKGTIRLDLDAIEARIDAAEKITSMQATTASVSVVPTITTASGTFSPALKMDLTPLKFSLNGGAASLVVKNPGTTAQKTVTAATLGLPGHPLMTVRAARILFPPLALLCALVVVAIVVGARVRMPANEAAAIQRRYGPLLVRLDAMPMETGTPIVDVTGFGMLARLAERYGLLITHWPEGDSEVFLAQDLVMGYRYRAGLGPRVQPVEAVTPSAPSRPAHAWNRWVHVGRGPRANDQDTLVQPAAIEPAAAESSVATLARDDTEVIPIESPEEHGTTTAPASDTATEELPPLSEESASEEPAAEEHTAETSVAEEPATDEAPDTTADVREAMGEQLQLHEMLQVIEGVIEEDAKPSTTDTKDAASNGDEPPNWPWFLEWPPRQP